MTDTCTTSAVRPNWQAVRAYEDIRFERDGGLAKITICRPEVRNAFRPKTLFELIDAFSRARRAIAAWALGIKVLASRASPSSWHCPCRSVPAQGTAFVRPKRRVRSSALIAACPASRRVAESFCSAVRMAPWHSVRH